MIQEEFAALQQKQTSPYERLYASSVANILWGAGPGRLLPALVSGDHPKRALDIGCGDGKNALYLEQAGYRVHGVDCAEEALRGLRNRFAAVGLEPKGKYLRNDVADLRLRTQSYGALISYGLFHCLPTDNREEIHLRLQASICVGGRMAFTCLTDRMPLSGNHLTPGVSLARLSEVKNLMRGWRVEHWSEGTIVEEHPPFVGEHAHSAVWVMARRVST